MTKQICLFNKQYFCSTSIDSDNCVTEEGHDVNKTDDGIAAAGTDKKIEQVLEEDPEEVDDWEEEDEIIDYFRTKEEDKKFGAKES